MMPNRHLKQERELRGWSQARVANEIGTDATTVSRWERGLFSPTPYFRERLCALFNKNAEELGLLTSVDQPPECEQSDVLLHPATASSLQAHEAWSGEEGYLDSSLALVPPCWSDSTDIFTYILHSAAHDQQAHMLWKDAYVRALRGRSAEARQLGEASLRAFERIGHVNARVVREWLNQQFQNGGTPAQAGAQSATLAASPEPPPARRTLSQRGARLALMLIGSFLLLFSLNLPA